jgi:hypothetical protein
MAHRRAEGGGRTPLTDVPPSAVVQCFAVFAKRAFHYWWIADDNAPQNVRRGLLQLYDENLAALTETTQKSSRRGNAKALEASVSALLWMGGMSPVHIGEWGTTDAPDVLGVSPSGNVVAVECTSGGLRSENKLQKLQDRVIEIREQMGRMGKGHMRVLPLLVTTRPRSEVELEIPDFSVRGILVLAREELEEAVRRTSASLNGDETFAELETRMVALRDQERMNRQEEGAIQTAST